MGQTDLLGDDPSISLEEHLGRLYFEMHNARTEISRRDYFDLVRLYYTELLTTTNWMIDRAGALKRLLTRELQLRRSVDVITFNHDLLVENALAQISKGRRGSVWCMRHGYGWDWENKTIQNTSPLFEYDCPGNHEKHVRLFKLHGSVNWVFRTRDPYPPRDFEQKRGRDMFLWINKELPAREVRLRTSARGWYLWPLIVPPIYEKHGFIRNELRLVWQEADEVLRSADNVIFWGYSFPRADLHARYFFQSAANANAAMRKPVLINPDSEAQTELWKVLRADRVEHYRDIRDVLNA